MWPQRVHGGRGRPDLPCNYEAHADMCKGVGDSSGMDNHRVEIEGKASASWRKQLRHLFIFAGRGGGGVVRVGPGVQPSRGHSGRQILGRVRTYDGDDDLTSSLKRREWIEIKTKKG